MKIKIEFVDPEANQKLDTVLALLQELKERMMTAFTDLNDLLTAIDTKTNEMGAEAQDISLRIDALLAQIAGGVNPAEAATLIASAQTELAKLNALGEGLTALAHDPANPIP